VRREYAYIKNNSDNFYKFSYSLENEFQINSKFEKAKISQAGVKELIRTRKNGKNDSIISKLNYDNKGNCISAVFNNKKGKLKQQFVFAYSPENLLLSKSLLNGKGKELLKNTYAYNSDSLIIETVNYKKEKEVKKNTIAYNKYHEITEHIFYKRGKIKAKTTSEYDSTRIVQSKYFKNGSSDYKWKWVYTYYDKKSRKSSMIYKSGDKLKYTWNYDCKPEGELLSKHKDSSLICLRTEFDKDSNKTYINREFNELGKPRKVVTVFSKQKKVIEYDVYHGSNIPDFSFKYNKITGEIEQQIFYNFKGNERWKISNTFDSNNNIVEEDGYRKGVLNFKSIRLYNARNLITGETNFNKQNEVENTTKFEYVFF